MFDPIPFVWVKDPEVPGWYPTPINIGGADYERDQPTRLPRGEPIGVFDRFWPRVGKIVSLLPDERGPEAARFRDVLKSYGFNWGGRRFLQADHVQDVQWGAYPKTKLDQFNNLWPMDGAANASAGPRQNTFQRVEFCETPRGPHRVMTIGQMKKEGKAGRQMFGRFFVIARIDPWLQTGA